MSKLNTFGIGGYYRKVGPAIGSPHTLYFGDKNSIRLYEYTRKDKPIDMSQYIDMNSPFGVYDISQYTRHRCEAVQNLVVETYDAIRILTSKLYLSFSSKKIVISNNTKSFCFNFSDPKNRDIMFSIELLIEKRSLMIRSIVKDYSTDDFIPYVGKRISVTDKAIDLENLMFCIIKSGINYYSDYHRATIEYKHALHTMVPVGEVIESHDTEYMVKLYIESLIDIKSTFIRNSLFLHAAYFKINKVNNLLDSIWSGYKWTQTLEKGLSLIVKDIAPSQFINIANKVLLQYDNITKDEKHEMQKYIFQTYINVMEKYIKNLNDKVR